MTQLNERIRSVRNYGANIHFDNRAAIDLYYLHQTYRRARLLYHLNPLVVVVVVWERINRFSRPCQRIFGPWVPKQLIQPRLFVRVHSEYISVVHDKQEHVTSDIRRRNIYIFYSSSEQDENDDDDDNRFQLQRRPLSLPFLSHSTVYIYI